MKRLMIDMDNCITDALFIERINEFLGTNYKLNEQSEFRLQNLLGNKVNDFWKYMENKSFYDDVKLIDGCAGAMKKLNEKYELYIITAFLYPDSKPDINGNNLKFIYEYLRKNLPFISPKQYIFIEDKEIIQSDIAIDDRLKHLKSAKTKILFDAWHNRNISDETLKEQGVIRVHTWKEIMKILDNNN